MTPEEERELFAAYLRQANAETPGYRDPTFSERAGMFGAAIGSTGADLIGTSAADTVGAFKNVLSPVAQAAGGFARGLTGSPMEQGSSYSPQLGSALDAFAEKYNGAGNAPLAPENDLTNIGPPPPMRETGPVAYQETPEDRIFQSYLDSQNDLRAGTNREARLAEELGRREGAASGAIADAMKERRETTDAIVDRESHSVENLATQIMNKQKAYSDAVERTINARESIDLRDRGIFENKSRSQKVGMALAVGFGALLSPITGYKNQFYDMFKREANEELREQIEEFNKASDVMGLRGNDYAQLRAGGVDAINAITAYQGIKQVQLSNYIAEIAKRHGDETLRTTGLKEAQNIRNEGLKLIQQGSAGVVQKYMEVAQKQADEQQRLYIPGVGFAQDVESKKKAQETLVNYNKLTVPLQKLIAMREAYGSEIVGENRKVMDSLTEQLQLAYKDLVRLGQISAGDQKKLDAAIPRAAKLGWVLPQLMVLRDVTTEATRNELGYYMREGTNHPLMNNQSKRVVDIGSPGRVK